jgi:hypothetical protein
MGIDAQLQDEGGGIIEAALDPGSLVTKLIDGIGELKNTVCLRFIDPYGDTTFNQLQIPVLLDEISNAIKMCEDEHAIQHGEKLIRMLGNASGDVHIYVKFIGD